MPTIADYYKYAKLATASYIIMDGQALDAGSLAFQADAQDRVPGALAQQLFLHTDPNDPSVAFAPWIVRDGGYHGNDAVGFAATLYHGPEESVLAIRGTEPSGNFYLDVLQADLAGIGLLGVSLPQAVSMFNYIMRIKASTDDHAVTQLRVHTSETVPLEPWVRATSTVDGAPIYIYFTTSMTTGLGLLEPGETITVTGHSLGGHLAALAARLFPSLISDTYTFNAPGFDPTLQIPPPAILQDALAAAMGPAAANMASTQRLTDELVSLFSLHLPQDHGAAESFAGLNLHAMDSEDLAWGDDADVISGILTGETAAGQEAFVTTEANSHVIEPIMDSLSLQALFHTLNPSIGLEDMARLYEAASDTVNDSQEQLFEQLYKLFEDEEIDLPIVDAQAPPFGTLRIGRGDDAARREYYNKLVPLERTINDIAAISPLELRSLVDNTIDIASLAQTDIGYRYALRELIPFAVLGAGYSEHNIDGELDLYDEDTDLGMSEQWLAARARFSDALIAYNIVDGEITFDAYFEDLRLEITLGPVAGNPSRTIFANDDLSGQVVGFSGDDFLFGGLSADRIDGEAGIDYIEGGGGADNIFGGGHDDEIYGNAGQDVISGGQGDDYLEGGLGRDRLEGGNDADELNGFDCAPGDVLNGGKGYDIYTVDFGDVIMDDPEASAGEVWLALDCDLAPVQLTGGSREEGESFYTSGDGRFKYWADARGGILVFSSDASAGDVPLQIAAPNAPVPGHQDTDTESIRGRPDLGIALRETKKDPDEPETPSLQNGSGANAKGLWELARTWRAFSDPLALDLEDDGFQTVGDLGAATVLFDHDGNGVLNGTGWLMGEDAWVVLDRDGDGEITSGQELFGVDTVLPAGTTGANGFVAITPLDTNGDRRVDAADGALEAWQIRADANDDGIIGVDETRGAEFGDLRLWRDENLNGVSEFFELSTLADAGIAAISLNYQSWGSGLPGGNVLAFRSTYIRGDGTTGTAGALDLTRETFRRDYISPPVYSAGIEALPAMIGSGQVRDLQEAAGASSALRAALEAAAAAPTRAAQLSASAGVVAEWADTSGMLTGTQAAARRADKPLIVYSFPGVTTKSVQEAYLAATGGVPVNPASLPAGWFEAQQSQAYRDRLAKLEELERYIGQTWANIDRANSFAAYHAVVPTGVPGQNTVHAINAINASIGQPNWQFLEDAHASIAGAVYGATAAPTRLQPYVDAIIAGTATHDFSAARDLLDAKRAADPGAALADLVDLMRYMGQDILARGFTDLPLLLRQWGDEARADPAQQPLLGGLDIRFQGDFFDTGSQRSDVLFGATDGFRLNMQGLYGDDVLFGRTTVERLYADEGNDIVYAGAGTQLVTGGLGRDAIVFGRGSGIDQMNQLMQWWFPMRTSADRDVLYMLPDVRPEDIRARAYSGPLQAYAHGSLGNGIRLQIIGTDDMFFDDGFATGDTRSTTDTQYRMLDEVRFTDGTVWDVATLRLKRIEGSELDDRQPRFGLDGVGHLIGYDDSDDTIDGKAGDDFIWGADGNDTLIGGSGEDEILAGYGNDFIDGGTGNDRIEGYYGDDTFRGGPGNDTLYGGPGVDTYILERNGGLDILVPNNWQTPGGEAVPVLDVLRADPDIAPQDVLLARIGQRSVVVTIAGTDTRVTDQGNEFNPLYAGEFTGTSFGRVEFADGTVWDNAEIRRIAILATEGDDLRWGYAMTGDTMRGLGGNDDLTGDGGNDFLYGDAGADTLKGGSGNDTLEGGEGADVLFGEGEDDALFGGEGDDSLTGDGPFGTTGNDFLDGGAGDDNLDGADGADTLHGGTGNDNLRGGLGNDVLAGGAGDDVIFGSHFASSGETNTLLLARGDGSDTADYVQVIRFDASVAPAEVDAWRENDHLIFAITGTGDRVRTMRTELARVEFADGTIWDAAFLAALPSRATEGSDIFFGTEGNDEIFTLGGSDTIHALGGDDLIDGGAGNDQMYGGAGDDRYIVGSGDSVSEGEDAGHDTVLSSVSFFLGSGLEDLTLTGDSATTAHGNSANNVLIGNAAGNVLDGQAGADLMQGGAGNDQYHVDNELDSVVELANEGVDLVHSQISYTLGEHLENLTLMGGENLEGRGNDFDNQVRGNFGANLLRGGRGNDSLVGAGGADTYVFTPGDGIDTIEDGSSGGDLNVLRLESIAPGDVAVLGSDIRNVTLTIGTSDRINLRSTAPGLAVAQIEFADGTVWSAQDVADRLPPPPPLPGFYTGTEGDDVLTGTAAQDVFQGLGGNDVLTGLAGDDQFDGGPGNDLLAGGAGNDVYQFTPGHGIDTIRDEASAARFTSIEDTDTLNALAAAGVLNYAFILNGQTGVTLGVAPDALIVRTGPGDELRIEGFDPADALGDHALKLLVFLDPTLGVTYLSYADLLARGFDLTGTAADEELLGTNLEDRYVFAAGSGNDRFIDAGGSDRIAIAGVAGDVAVTRSGTDIVLRLSASDSLSILWDRDAGSIVEEVRFADGTSWDDAELEALAGLGGGDNAAPTVANEIADQAASEDAAFSFTVPADAFSDPDASDTLTYTSGSLPAWLSFDAGSRTFTGTPLQSDVGEVEVTVTATDGGGLSAQDTFTLTVANVNDLSAVSASNTTLILDTTVAASSLFSVADEDGDAPAQYEFWDSTAGNGHFAVNGVEAGVNVAIAVSAADLANATFTASGAIGADQVWVRVNDGQAWGGWKSWTVDSSPHLTNALPVVTAANAELLLNDSVAAASLFSVTDADGDPITRYEFWDDVVGGGYLSVAGIAQGTNPIAVTTEQLGDVAYHAGSAPGTERVWVRASDGIGWSAWKAWNMTSALHVPNAAPEVSAQATQTVTLGQAVDASTLFSATDGDADPIASYEFWDSTAGNGHFSVSGVEQGVNVAIAVTGLEEVQFVGAAETGSDLVWVRASDGQTWGEWKSWTLNSWPHATNSALVVSASSGSLLTNEAVAASSLFSVSDADGDAAVRYEFWDDVNGGGYWRVNGAQQGAAQTISVSAADLANTQYVAGSSGGTEQVWVRANDGLEWSAWKAWSMASGLHIPNAAPVVSAASSQTLVLNDIVEASTLFSVTDADDDVITQYEFWDSSAGGGHFTVDGVQGGVSVAIAVTAAQLGTTQFVGSSAIGSDLVWARANDGQSWSDWKSWTMQSSLHLTNEAPVASAANGGLLRAESVAGADLFAVSDANGDSITQYQFWDDVNGGGHWALNGAQQAAGQNINVAAADLANLAYVGGSNPGTEQVWVRASDGMAWGAWKNWLMSTEGGMLRGGLAPDTLTGEAGPTVLEGGGGDDTLSDTEGNNLLNGGEGDDQMTAGDGNDLLAGGDGDDTLHSGGGANVIAYNAGDGYDVVFSDLGAANTLSFGGGIAYDDLSLSRNGDDLVVNTGTAEGVTLKDWYAGKDNVLDMQVILDASDAFDAGSSDPLYSRRVQTFDFRGLVSRFDQALAQSPGLTSWALTNALLQFHLSASDDSALGGDLAYWHGKNGGFAGISLQAAQQMIGSAGFGSDAQTLRPFNGLQDGFVKLS